MSGQAVTYSLYLNSNVRQALVETEFAAAKLDKTMSTAEQTTGRLSRTLTSMRDALNAYYIYSVGSRVFSLGEDMVKQVGDYESSMIKIKNASVNAYDGIKNQLFIKDAASRFKIDLTDAADNYGSFLLKIKAANLSSGTENNLYGNLLKISKVSGLGQGEVDATVRNISTMLGEGVLEARHMRGIYNVHPQLLPFIAQALGIKGGQKDEFSKLIHDEGDATMLQKLSRLVSSGKLTKLGMDSRVLVDAVQAYADSIDDSKLNESLQSLNSNTAELGNAWFLLKESIIMDLKPSLIDLFKQFESGTKWFIEHKDTIGLLLKLYLEFSIAMKANNIVKAFEIGLLESSITKTGLEAAAKMEDVAATQALVLSTKELALAREEAFNLANAGLLGTAIGTGGIGGLEGGMMAGATGSAAIEGATVGLGLSLASILSGTIITVGVAWIADSILSSLMSPTQSGHSITMMEKLGLSGLFGSRDNWAHSDEARQMLGGDEFGVNNALAKQLGYDRLSDVKFGKDGSMLPFSQAYPESRNYHDVNPKYDLFNSFYKDENGIKAHELYSYPRTIHNNSRHGKSAEELMKADRIKGNSINNININIGEMNGMKGSTFNTSNMGSMESIEKEVGVALTRILSQAVNDSQQVAQK